LLQLQALQLPLLLLLQAQAFLTGLQTFGGDQRR
jgi:hypothetical protein